MTSYSMNNEDDCYVAMIEEENGSEESASTSLLDIIRNDSKTYTFACLMGMLSADTVFVSAGISKLAINISNYLLFLLLLIGFAVFLVEAILFPTARNFAWLFFITFQDVMIYYGVFQLRSVISLPRIANVCALKSICSSSLVLSKYVLGLLCFLEIPILINMLVSIQSGALSILSYASYMLSFFAGNCYLVGILFVLVIEQRTTRYSLRKFMGTVKSSLATNKSYFSVRKEIQEREHQLPINALVMFALINVLFALTLIIMNLPFDESILLDLYFIAFLLIAFCKEMIFLLLLLREIVEVNALSQKLIDHLARTEWSNDTVRQSVLLAALSKPIGSAIFFTRPTRSHILLQVAATILASAIAIARFYFLTQ